MMKHTILWVSLLGGLAACEQEPAPLVSTQALEPFNEIRLDDPFEVFLAEGDSYAVEVIGDESTIGAVNFTVTDSLLHISNSQKLRWRSPHKNSIKLYLTAPPLKQVLATEGCHIQTVTPITSREFGLILKGKANQAHLTLDTEIFYYWNTHPCGGKVTLSGQTETLKIWNIALMSVDARALSSHYALIENSSKGDCEVTVLKQLEYSIEGTGNILLHGNPATIMAKNETSTGRLVLY